MQVRRNGVSVGSSEEDDFEDAAEMADAVESQGGRTDDQKVTLEEDDIECDQEDEGRYSVEVSVAETIEIDANTEMVSATYLHRIEHMYSASFSVRLSAVS